MKYLVSAGWLIYVIAWFVPVERNLSSLPDGLPGWEALSVALSPILDPNDSDGPWYLAVLWTMTGATNLLMAAAPFVFRWGTLRLTRRFGWAFVIAFGINAYWASVGSDLRVGYFLWWLSFLLLGVGFLRMGRGVGGSITVK